MKRRNFLKNLSLLGAPMLMGHVPVSAINPLGMLDALNFGSDRILVLINLNGGNDGLNTLIPLDQYSILQSLRPNLILPENKLLSIEDDLALHPSMTGIQNMYKDGLVRIVQDVGYVNQNRSHFRSKDIWTSASEADVVEPTGWLGRYFGDVFPDYPEAYPNNDCPDPIALSVGDLVSETCQGESYNFSLSVDKISDLRPLDDSGTDSNRTGCHAEAYAYVYETILKTNAYAGQLVDVYDAGVNSSNKYNEDEAFAEHLKTVARLISGGLQTKVYVVQLGGFDTHSDQVTAEDSSIGQHGNLLKIFSDGVEAFFDDLKQQGLENRVTAMTFSEFGRQIRSNQSLGTDHGTAGPMFIFGECVQSGTLGVNTSLNTDIPVQTGMPMQYDFRDVYGSVLEQWFEATPTDVQKHLYDGYTALPIYDFACIASNDDLPAGQAALKLKLQPNPCTDYIQIEMPNANGKWNYFITDVRGGLVEKGIFASGQMQARIKLDHLVRGMYFLRLVQGQYNAMGTFVKQ